MTDDRSSGDCPAESSAQQTENAGTKQSIEQNRKVQSPSFSDSGDLRASRTKEPYPIIADRFPAQRSYQSFRENRAVHLFFLTGKNSTRPSLNNLQLHPGPKAEPIPD
jgi:hypothetical protein